MGSAVLVSRMKWSPKVFIASGAIFARGGFLGAAINLGHLEHFVTVTTFLVSFAGAEFARAQVVVPGIVHKRDALIDGGMDQANGLTLRGRLA
jgi:hypothetical protein